MSEKSASYTITDFEISVQFCKILSNFVWRPISRPEQRKTFFLFFWIITKYFYNVTHQGTIEGFSPSCFGF